MTPLPESDTPAPLGNATAPASGSVGARPTRPDGAGKVDGSAVYVDDLAVEGAWHGATLRSERPRARFTLDTSALTDREVVCLTAADVPGTNRIALIADDWPVLADGEARHVGEALALVAAPTRAEARAAVAELRVAYEDLPAEVDLDDALAGSARELAACAVEHGDVVSGLAQAAHVLEATYETAHQEHAYIEPQGMIAVPHDDGSVEVIGSLQCPYYVHHALVALLGCEAEGVRVRQAVTGGGFGGKEDYPDMIAAHAVLLAARAGRPVKVIYDRREDMLATTRRHPSRVRHKTGVDADGKLLAVEIEVLLDGGAYTTLSPVVLSRAVLHAAGPYACPNVRIRGRVLATNTATNGAFRGFGAPQSQFAAERQMDRVAREVGVDPLTIRERNAYRPGDVTPTGQVLGASTSAHACLAEAERRTGFRERWKALEGERAAARDDGRPRGGIGLSLCWHGVGFTGNGERRMDSPVAVRLAPGGRLVVLAASTDIGQGTQTVLAQIAAEAAGVPFEAVALAPADTAVVPDSGPTVASRTVMVVGGILARAAAELARRVREHAPGESFAAAADAWLAERGELEVVERYADDGTVFDEATYRGDAYAVHGWGADVVEVSVDPDTLVTRAERATLVCDVGKAIHPLLCAGQVEGGSLQAFGWGHLEAARLRDGRLEQDSFSTYTIPTSLDAPAMETVLLEHPGGSGPLGAKGVGEIPMDGGAPALLAAIENAVGISAARIPATPEVLFEARERGASDE
ncbi:MAG: xanthine dehydrogenase family protein molybdopterin-binding subunit [Planctomycetota bacterium]|jgi:CO/xanthine dehydrogenase Mo-binding subunit|nr:xanthine dehydrogenase family protein molybdopterin-binding subunit [Planctomycetota bacterium]